MARRRNSESHRAISITQLVNSKFDVMEFEGEWLEHIGRPEITGSWLIAGNGKNGKTSYSFQLAKYLTRFARVAYDTLEEGVSQTIKDAVNRTNFAPLERKRCIILNKEPIEDLRIRLAKKKAPRIIIIDSVQYSGLGYKEYRQLKDDFPGKLFIWISHMDGNYPAGQVARRIMYDANMYIRVIGFKALPQGRCGGRKEYVIWPEEAIKYQ